MSKTTTLTAPGTFGLSLACMTATAREFDWSALYEREEFEIVYPAPTFADVDDHARDLLSVGQRQHMAKLRDKTLPEALAREWEDSDGCREWQDGFFPMMNFAWPVELAYQVTAEQAAQLMAEFAPPCTLVKLSEGEDSYVIALSGGGMDLSDQIAAAYLCCGVCPPTELLCRVPGVITAHKAARVGDAFKAAFEGAKAWHQQRVEDIDRESARFAEVLGKAAA